MRIAQIAPLIERVPPKKYGGTERVVYALTEELVKMGHDVTLFASGDSVTSAKLKSVYPKSLRESGAKESQGKKVLSCLNVGFAYSQQDKFDIVHDHTAYLGLPSANISTTPTVFTLHGPLTPEIKLIFSTLNKPYLIGISSAQIKKPGKMRYLGTVYNGLDMNNYPFSKEHDNYLLFVGRISYEKGVHNAIEVAQYLNLPLIIAAKLDNVDLPYFNEYIGPRLSDQIRWIGEVGEKERNDLMSKALCFLHPITWPEPFGLTMIEAMACGCPVVAMRLGSVPEVVQNGKTGFVVDDVSEMIEAVQNIDLIDREYCRDYARQTFSAKRMAQGYEAVYQQILTGQSVVHSNQSKLNGKKPLVI